MGQIGLYSQITEFTNDNAGTAEWCKAERDGKIFFIKRFQSPVYPSKEIELPEKKRIDRINRFHSAMNEKKVVYQRLQKCDSRGSLVIPFEVMNYQYHICAIANYAEGNIKAEDVCHLSEWQRLVLMRTLTFAVMKIHEAGLVHSDLKPENVIIFQDAEGNCKIKLIDFDGSFFASSPPEEAENVTGDPAYLAPEVLRFCAEENIHLDYHMDVFALGLILHYFWSGKLPEKPANQTMGEYLLRGGILVLDGSLPLALQKTIQGMLAVDPNERINIEKVYSVLGAQISLRHREITKLTEKTEYIHKPKRYEIEVDKYAETDEEPKYKASAKSPRSKTILKKKRKHKKGKILSVLRIAACFLIFLMLVGEPGIIIKTEEYFSNLKSVQTTLASAAPDPAPLKAASQTASPETARSFSVIDISSKKGKTTIQWEDSLDAGPYIVSYKYAGEGSAKQAKFYAGKDGKSSTTHFKYFNTNRLIPGEKYIVEVVDSLGTAITKNYYVPWEGVYSEGQLSVASVEVSAKKVYESPAGNGELAAFQANTMSMNMENGYSFGLYYKVEMPELKSSKSYFTQIFMKGPNGFAQTIVAEDVSYQSNMYHYWNCLGSYFFDRIKHYNGAIPSGEYTVELFFDGMWVDMLTFSIT